MSEQMSSDAKIFAVGDIHGCLDKLIALLDLIPIQLGRDTLVFMGDYIDRGSHSKEVVDRLIELGQSQSKVFFLKGNHEVMLLKYLSGADKSTYLLNGGLATLESYKQGCPYRDIKKCIPESHMTFYTNLLLSLEIGEYIFVHAGVRPGISMDEQEERDMLWIREEFVSSTDNFGKKVIFGHTPFAHPLVSPNKIGVDTGAGYGSVLTCVELPSIRFYSA